MTKLSWVTERSVMLLAFSQLIIHGVPNLSVSMPNFLAQKVSLSAMRTVPLSASALKTRSACSGSFKAEITEKPCIGS